MWLTFGLFQRARLPSHSLGLGARRLGRSSAGPRTGPPTGPPRAHEIFSSRNVTRHGYRVQALHRVRLIVSILLFILPARNAGRNGHTISECPPLAPPEAAYMKWATLSTNKPLPTDRTCPSAPPPVPPGRHWWPLPCARQTECPAVFPSRSNSSPGARVAAASLRSSGRSPISSRNTVP